jgi:alpha-N-arabinofuranosidase
MGRLRAEQGHPEPYDVRIWEIGNELHGTWQVGWTTAGGYVDRYRRFVEAMRRIDPAIRIVACGDQLLGLKSEWNRRLIDESEPPVETLADHLLTGGLVGSDTDPIELYHGFMGYASTLDRLYGPVIERMSARGASDPHIAVTELQLFAHFRGPSHARKPLRPETLPTPATISEGLYVLTMILEFIRMQGTVEMLTHSATVNHGGGLRKAHERVWANPVHHVHRMAGVLAGGTPVKVHVTCDRYSTTQSFGHIPAHSDIPVLDAVAVVGADERELIVLLANRSAGGQPIDLVVVPGSFAVRPEAHVLTLAGNTMYDQNTLTDPERIVPQASTLAVEGGGVRLSISPFVCARVTFGLLDAA